MGACVGREKPPRGTYPSVHSTPEGHVTPSGHCYLDVEEDVKASDWGTPSRVQTRAGSPRGKYPSVHC